MKISFLIAEEHVLEVFVSEDRDVAFKGSMTGDVRVSYDRLLDDSGQGDKVEAGLFKAIVRDLKSLSDVEKYIIHEVTSEPALKAVGVEYLRTEV